MKKSKKDLDALAASYDAFYQIAANSVDGIVIISPERKIHYGNQSAMMLLGFPMGEPIIGLGFPWPFKIQETTCSNIEDWKGRLRSTEIRAMPARWKNEKATLIFIRDVSERLVAQEAQIEAEREKVRNQMKSEFLANMSHEIRSPLNSIIGATEILRRGGASPKQKKFLEIMSRSGTSLLALISDILDLSKIEAAQVEIERSPVNIVAFSQSLIDSFSNQAFEKGLTLNLYIDPRAAGSFSVDPSKLSQILINLVDNAIKFTHTGKVDLRVNLKPDEEAITFCVRDTGIGIPANKFGAIFEAFRQVDASTSRNFGGTGLGLHIAKKLAALLGGEISVRSRLNQGSIFTVQLPFQESGNQKQNIVSDADFKESAIDKIEMGRRVLIIDDEPPCHEIYSEYMASASFSSDHAFSCAEGLKMFSAGQYDAIILDLQMPGVDGFETAQQIRSFEQKHGRAGVPILAISALALRADFNRAVKAGCTLHLAKPIRMNEFLRALASVMSK